LPLPLSQSSSHSLLHCQSRRVALAATMLLQLMVFLSADLLGSRLQPARISPADRPVAVSIRPAIVQALEKRTDPGPASPRVEPLSAAGPHEIAALVPEVKPSSPPIHSPLPRRPLKAKQPASGSKKPPPAVAQTPEAPPPDSAAEDSATAAPLSSADLVADAAVGPPSATSEAGRSEKTSGYPIASLQNSSAARTTAEAKHPDHAEIDQIIAALVAVVEQHKRYPQVARRAGYEGTVQVSVKIDRQGFIRGYELINGSGRSVLDDSALAIFRRIGDIRIASMSIDRDLTLIVPVRYALN